MDHHANPLDYILKCSEQGLVPKLFSVQNAKDEVKRLTTQLNIADQKLNLAEDQLKIKEAKLKSMHSEVVELMNSIDALNAEKSKNNTSSENVRAISNSDSINSNLVNSVSTNNNFSGSNSCKIQAFGENKDLLIQDWIFHIIESAFVINVPDNIKITAAYLIPED